MRTLRLSPDGKTLALFSRNEVEDVLMTLDLATMTPSVVTQFGPRTGGLNLWWKSNDLLLMKVLFLNKTELRVVSLRDGKTRELRDLNHSNCQVVSSLPTDPDCMLVSIERPTGSDLRRINLRTGRMETVEKNPGPVFSWIVNQEGAAIAALGFDNNRWFMLTRSPGTSWTRTELGTRARPDFLPIAPYAGNRLLGCDFSSDLATIVAWDPRTQTKETVLHSPEAEFRLSGRNGNDTVPHTAFIDTDRRHIYCVNEPDRQLQRKIDEALPGTTNQVVSASVDESRLIIASSIPSSVTSYWLLDRKAGRIASLGVDRTSLAQAKLSRSSTFSLTTRDGLRLHARLYLPTSTSDAPPPAVVLVDNINRGIDLSWSPLIQLLATRGYAVLQVAHRGSPGYGLAFAEAGDMHVHDEMPDDIVDAVEFAIRQSWIDGRRLAILGAESGGVLATYALSRHPEKFAAWINFDTPLIRASVPLAALVVGRPEVRTSGHLTVRDESKLKDYVYKLDASHILESLQIPSFHFYYRDPAARSLIKGKLRDRSFTFIEALSWNAVSNEPATRARQFREEDERIYGALISFLDTHVKTPSTPATNAATPDPLPNSAP